MDGRLEPICVAVDAVTVTTFYLQQSKTNERAEYISGTEMHFEMTPVQLSL
jgi:hypothetical protein